jgi:eukaryotic-like serine/threonine-protein kinase
MIDPPDRELAVFSAARLLHPGERGAYLDQACAGDAALRQRVEELLRAGDEAGAFLDQPAPGAQRTEQAADASGPNPTMHIAVAPAEKSGDRIGRYKLLQQIGEGGCGVVYMAEQQEPVRRMVALKVIKLGMDTKSVIARFEAERQALALMDHPNIAKVLEAGATETGRPYFVMELVRGIKITDYCDKANQSTRERLNLFVQVCEAIQHAHQKGVIHRDIKPSNILVTLRDGVPVPKVIDFGIAKATTDQRLTDKTLFTAFEQFIGTPAYMSPEQAEMSELGIDTRSDIYSLGVLLYELLTGQTPFDAKELLQAGLDAMRRIIREQEPARPSTRLSTLLEVERTIVANHRQTDAPKLVHLLRGDLDWIVIKSLEKDRARRYETANGLAMDVQRYLDNEPVVARPPSNFYRFQKLASRNKLALTAIIAVIGALVIGLGLSTWQFIEKSRAEREQSLLRVQAEEEKKQAQIEAAKSQQVAQLLKDMLAGVGPSVAMGRDTKLLREILDKTAEHIGKELTNQPAVEEDLRLTLAGTYRELGLYEQMRQMAGVAFQLGQMRLGPESPDVADALDSMGIAEWKLGHMAEAEAALRKEIAMRKNLPGKTNRDLGDALSSLTAVLCDQSKFSEAERTADESIAMLRKAPGDQSLELADALESLANVRGNQGKWADSEALEREAVAMNIKLVGENNPRVATALNSLAVAVSTQSGREAETESLNRKVLAMRRTLLGDEHPDVAEALVNLSWILRNERKLPEAENAASEAVAIAKKAFGNEHPKVATALNELGLVLLVESKYPQAEAVDREAVAIGRKVLGNENENLAYMLEMLVLVLMKEDKHAEAEALMHESYEIRRKVRGDEHPEVAHALDLLSWTLESQGKLSGAEALRRDALASRRKRLGDGSAGVVESLIGLSSILRAQAKLPEAESVDREVLAIARNLVGKEQSSVAVSLNGLAWSLLTGNKAAEAEPVARETLAIRRKLLGNENLSVTESLDTLAWVLSGEGKHIEGESMAREGLAIREKLLGHEHEQVAQSLYVVGSMLRRQGKLAEAEPVYDEALGMRRKLLGNESLGVVESLINLGSMLADEGKLGEAETMDREALATRRKLLGNENLEVANSFADLAFTLQAQDKLAEAEADYRETLAIRRKLLGDNHWDVAEALRGVAWMLQREGKLADAESLVREALAIRKKLVGAEHLQVAEVLGNLAGIIESQGRHADAETVEREALTIRRKLLGNEDASTIKSVNALAIILLSQHKNVEAEQLFGDFLTPALEGKPQSAGLLRGRGMVRARQGQWKEAAADFCKAIALDPTVHSDYHSLAPLLVQSGDLKGYRRYCALALARFGGTKDPLIAERIARDSLILPDSGADLDTVGTWVDTAVTLDKHSANLPWLQFCKGMAEYRQGHFTNTVEWTQRALATASPNRDVEAYAVLAMAQQRLRQVDESRATLAKAIEIERTKLPKLDSGDLGENWMDWIIAHVLLREAQTLIEVQSATAK